MDILQYVIIFMAFSSVKSKPTTESTHAILKRLGFDLVQRSPTNHHSKRVALETNKARYHNEFYNYDTDSQMFVVKLPPHAPYYSQMKPEKFKNDTAKKSSLSFRTNGKPGRIYHWNIPVLKRINQRKKEVRNVNEDSKVYRVRILPSNVQKYYSLQDPHGNSNKHKKQKNEEKLETVKFNKYYRNKVYRFSDSVNRTKNVTKVGYHMSNHPTQSITKIEKQKNNLSQKNQNGSVKKIYNKYTNEMSKIKNKNEGPNYYLPAIPKQNSFYKYFNGNGKPKSFYVIEKSKKPTRVHRLL